MYNPIDNCGKIRRFLLQPFSHRRLPPNESSPFIPYKLLQNNYVITKKTDAGVILKKNQCRKAIDYYITLQT